jgi:hypothetical protein
MSVTDGSLIQHLSELLDQQLLEPNKRGMHPSYAVVPRDLFIRAVTGMVLANDPDHFPVYLSPVGSIRLYYYADRPDLARIEYEEAPR